MNDQEQMFEVEFSSADEPITQGCVVVFPARVHAEGTWQCRALIKFVVWEGGSVGADSEQNKEIEIVRFGEDPFQALLLTFEAIRLQFDELGEFTLNHEPIWSILPRYVPYSYGRKIVKEIEEFIDKKVEEWNLDVESRRRE